MRCVRDARSSVGEHRGRKGGARPYLPRCSSRRVAYPSASMSSPRLDCVGKLELKMYKELCAGAQELP